MTEEQNGEYQKSKKESDETQGLTTASIQTVVTTNSGAKTIIMDNSPKVTQRHINSLFIITSQLNKP